MNFQMTLDKDELNAKLLKKLKALIDGPGKITLSFEAKEDFRISKEELLRRAKSNDLIKFTAEEFEEYSNRLLEISDEDA